MNSTVAILNTYGDAGVELLKNAVAPLSATGETINSIRKVVDSDGDTDRLMIVARKFFSLIETGRGPRKASQESGFLDNLKDYVNVRFGFLNDKERERMTKFLRWKINKFGDKTFQQGGREVYSQQLFTFVKELEGVIVKSFTNQVVTQVRGAFSGDKFI